jgi:hypothetical protein
MQPHVAMTSVFSFGPLKKIMINSIPKFLGEVPTPTSPLYLTNDHLFIFTVEMDNPPTELHYRGDYQGTLAIVGDG